MLVLSSVCRQFSALVTRTVHRRLHAMEALEKFQVGIIYYQPQQSVRSPVLCDYFGKEDVGDTCADKDPNVASSSCRLLTGYSRFCPEGTGNGSRHANARSEDDDPVRHSDAVRQRLFLNWIITLDDFEPFAQLCVGAHLFWKNDQMRKGSQAHIDNGTLSFWREWLDGRLEPHEPHEAHEPEDPGTETNSTGRGMGHPIDFRPGRRQVLWVGSHGHVGLKLSVTGRHRHIDPRDFSSYQVEFEGKKPQFHRSGDREPAEYNLVYL